MQLQIFTIPVSDTGIFQTELNHFLSGHKVLEIEQHFYQNEKGGYWSFCVRYIADAAAYNTGTAKSKVDYRTVLPEKEFAVFSQLREIRKALAMDDGVPAYAVFTDEELSGIARLPELTIKSLETVPGIGEKKVARYGKLMLEAWQKKSQNAAPEIQPEVKPVTPNETKGIFDAGHR
ncbi:hypothetical protein FACS1894176_01910 [Bacteroidia bacterium]|nr:hypothetical protein FACS1894176_01910 [Bacteroidia bacterium]